MDSNFITPLKRKNTDEYKKRTRGAMELQNFEVAFDQDLNDNYTHFGGRVVSEHSDIYISINGPFPLESTQDVDDVNFTVSYSKNAETTDIPYYFEKILASLVDGFNMTRTHFKISFTLVKAGFDALSLSVWAIASVFMVSGFTLNYIPVPINAAIVDGELLLDPSEEEYNRSTWHAELLMTNLGECFYQHYSSENMQLMRDLKDLAPSLGKLLVDKLKQK